MTHCITCSKRATFNYNGYNNAIYCGEHKLENMIDVKNKKCVFENCNKQFPFVDAPYIHIMLRT